MPHHGSWPRWPQRPIHHPLRTIVDNALSRFDEVWAAGGLPHFVVPTTNDELLRITAGEAAEIGA